MFQTTTAAATTAASGTPSPGATEAARSAGLRYVSHRDAGFSRKAAGKSFHFFDAKGARITDEAIVQRIHKLAIPPAYRAVWICANAKGHLQATGIDARGRRQYRYHPDWHGVRNGSKFERMVEFGEALPRLRRAVRRDLAKPGLPREKVLAVLVALLDATNIRIGNTEYARSNQSFGLTTLRNRHVKFLRDGRASLSFIGKGGHPHEVTLDDKQLVKLVRRCQQLPGQQLFQYLGDDGERHAVDSGQVNDYLREATGADFTAKDFRTWAGTLSAIGQLCDTALPESASERALAACINTVVKQVAAELRNTPAVCRKSYINPVVFEAWRTGQLHRQLGGMGRVSTRQALAFLRHPRKGTKRPARK